MAAELFFLPKSKYKAEVWRHFGFKKKDTASPPTEANLLINIAYCKHCLKQYKNHKATTTMKGHLESQHKEFICQAAAEQPSSSRPVIALSQPKLNFQSQRSTITKGKIDQIDKALMSLFTDKMLPISVIEHYSFSNLVTELEPRYKLPGRKAMTTRIIKQHEEAKVQLKKALQACQDIALTHDSWTSIHTESYDTTTAHFITSDWELKSAVLGTSHFPGAHTGENICNHLKETLKQWGITHTVFVTDNAANEQKGIRLLEQPKLGCYGHRLNLIVKNGLSRQDVSKLVGKGRAIVTFFHSSTSATELLLAKQCLLLPAEFQNHRLKQDVVTRWNSTLDMLERLNEQIPAIHAVITDESLGKRRKDLQEKMYTFEEQAEVKDLIQVLKPFKKATEMLSSDKNPTQGLILPAIKKLSKELEIKTGDGEETGDSDMIKRVKMEMRKQLDARCADTDYPLIASRLTPSIKPMPFATFEEHYRADELILRELIELNGQNNALKVNKSTARRGNIRP